MLLEFALSASILLLVIIPILIFNCTEHSVSEEPKKKPHTRQKQRAPPSPRKPVGQIFQNDLEEISENVAFHVIENKEENNEKPFDALYDIPDELPEGFRTTKNVLPKVEKDPEAPPKNDDHDDEKVPTSSSSSSSSDRRKNNQDTASYSTGYSDYSYSSYSGYSYT
ncbi:hypothetical protein TRFO_04065 [Tritrichomonas foetus]|uniref:Uncharacterized protein n=1 Tax=Tritrichomonas foetus TaxID=1144522 RepID=A0A1J4KNW2_9EUKA|nr:hypothetical protein TRFO_04065 [Tritrichomonas foetus]|eukprot:OHT11109.1 hypothetical protein TRFO_04065 [Tritrichomonas foetus]